MDVASADISAKIVVPRPANRRFNSGLALIPAPHASSSQTIIGRAGSGHKQ
ncbi:hypothetical protein GCM10023235_38770 [Kitasatospora terrestris]|uniref:Uncharacterized protein n=1 Tax=Kitasatospora terrestris TaxID=258051 RepID=A0ABP9DVB7_9ACTN